MLILRLSICWLVFNLSSCSDSAQEEEIAMRVSKLDLLSMALKGDPNVSEVLPKGMNEGIKCEHYPPGCLSGRAVQIKKLEMIALEYDNSINAERAAFILKQYHYKNWVFDDVAGEPTLEKFVVEFLSASKASSLP